MPIKVMKTSTYEDMLAASARCEDLEMEMEKLQARITELEQENHRLKKANETMEAETRRLSELTTDGEENEVILRIGDDLTTITPIVRWKEGVDETMIQMGIINDSENSKTSVQVALMMIGLESLEQIVENFTPEIAEG